MSAYPAPLALRLALMIVVCGVLAACASEPGEYVVLPRDRAHDTITAPSHAPLECVPYARLHSSVKLYGDAYTWWDQAAGRFSRRTAPHQGAVIVLTGYAGLQRAHVAVVRSIISSRQIRIDHANWLDDGAIYVNDPVEDVSIDNDWSRVRVWNIPRGGWGTNNYVVTGFIGPDREARPRPQT